MVVISNAFLYPAFAFLIGGLILSVVSEKYRPTLLINKTIFIYVTIGIIFLTAVPIFSLTLNIADIFNVSILKALDQVLFNFNIGKVWLQTIVITVLMIIVLLFFEKRKLFRYFALLLSLVLVVVVSQASHSASLQPTLGHIGHSIHFLSVSIWAGILFFIGLCAKDEQNWDRFLKWYTPLAIMCIAILTVSGLFIMKEIVPEYTNSFMLSYGQLLVIKHLLFLLVIFYGVINGFIIRIKLKRDTTFKPKKWLRLESLFLISTFVVTALMAEQAPPHNVSVTLERVEPSKIFEWVHGSVGPYSNVIFISQPLSIVFGLILLLSIIALFYSVIKNKRIFIAFLTSLLFLISSYLVIMSSVTVERPFETENRIYNSLEEAIMVGHSKEDQLTIFQTGNKYDDIIYVIYSVNESQLIAELLYKSDNGYERVKESRLTIGGIPIKDSEHKIRTFLITEGPWSQQGKLFTYVTIGYVQKPADVFAAEIEFQEEVRKLNVQNKAFFSLTASNEQWDTLHRIRFYNQEGEEIGAHTRYSMETDAFCH